MKEREMKREMNKEGKMAILKVRIQTRAELEKLQIKKHK